MEVEPAAQTRAELEVDLVAGHAGRDELVEPELLAQHQLDIRHGAREPGALEAVRQPDAPAAGLGVEERVADRERDLVAHRGRALGVAVEEDVVGHGFTARTSRKQGSRRQRATWG